jgi:hypothetical protein
VCARTRSNSRSSQRRLILVAFVLSCAVAVASCLWWAAFTIADVLGSGAEDSTVVREDGFSLSVGGVRVTSGAGVAPEGTTVTMTGAAVDVAGVAFGGATALREGMSISLDDEAQPEQPVQLEFRIPDDAVITEGSSVFVVAQSARQEQPELLEAQWNPAKRTMTATTNHFSLFVPVIVDVQKTLAGFGQAVDDVLMFSRTNQPACFGQDPLEGDASITVSPIAGQEVWPCLNLDGKTLSLQLQNNSPLVWEYASDPSVDPSIPTAKTAAGVIMAAMYPYIEGGSAQAIVLPDETGRIDYDISDLPITGELDALPAMMLVGILAKAVGEVMPPGWDELVSRAECVADIADAVTSESEAVDISVTVLNCFGSAVGGTPALILTLITSGPAALYGSIYGFWGEFADGNLLTFDITLDEPPASPLGDTAELTGKWEGPVRQDRSNYTMTLELTDSEGKLYGDVFYPELGCSGTWTETARSADTVSLTEVIDQDPRNTCATRVDIRISKSDGGLGVVLNWGGRKATADLTRD